MDAAFHKKIAERMEATLEHLKRDLAGLRTGRASLVLLDNVRVDYYGTSTPLKQVANLAVPESRLITIQPWEPSLIKEIEKAITDAGLGLNPSNDGNLIRLSIPPLTEERRRDLVKVVRHIAEEGRVKIRNVRRDVMHDLRELREAGEAGADDEHRAEVELQKLTDSQISELDSLLKGKEAEILEV